MDYSRRYEYPVAYPYPPSHWHQQAPLHHPNSHPTSSTQDYDSYGWTHPYSIIHSTYSPPPIPTPQQLWPSALVSQRNVAGPDARSSPDRRHSIPQTSSPTAPRSYPTPLDSVPPSSSNGPLPRRTLTDLDRLNMCRYADEYPQLKQTDIGEVFGVERSTVSKVLRDKEKYLQDTSTKTSKKRGSRHPDVERTLAVWLNNEEKVGLKPSDKSIIDQAHKFGAASNGGAESDFRGFDQQWLEQFKQRNEVGSGKVKRPSTPPRRIKSRKSTSDLPRKSIMSPKQSFRRRKSSVKPKEPNAAPTETVPDTIKDERRQSTSQSMADLSHTRPSSHGRDQQPRPPLPSVPELVHPENQYYYDDVTMQDPYSTAPHTIPAQGYSMPLDSPRWENVAVPLNNMPRNYAMQGQIPTRPEPYATTSPESDLSQLTPGQSFPNDPFDPPTTGQAQEALATLQTYLRHTRSSLDFRELDTIAKLERGRLNPSQEDFRRPSTNPSFTHLPYSTMKLEPMDCR